MGVVLNFFTYSGLSMVVFKENYSFQRFQRGFNIFQGGGGGYPTFSRGGSTFLETYRTCDFPGGGGVGPDPPLPSGSAHG